MVGSLADAGLTAEVADGQPLGQVTFCFTQQLLDLLSRSSLSHWLLLGSCATTTILAGPTFGEQTNSSCTYCNQSAEWSAATGTAIGQPFSKRRSSIATIP